MIKKHPNHIALGIGMMMIGTWLMANDRFFQWPPYAMAFVNDDIWGGLLIAIGLSLILWVLDGGECQTITQEQYEQIVVAKQ